MSPPFDARERLSYFVPSPSSPWQWTKDGRVIVWYDGSTVAFREEIEAILTELASDGLPPFGGVVLMLAALKGKTPDGSWMLGPAVLEEITSVDDVGGLRRQMSVRIERALDQLADVVATLSLQDVPALREPKGKAALAETLLAGEPRVCSEEEARQLIDDLGAGALEGTGWMRPSWRSASRLLNDVEALGRGWKGFDAASFTLRLHTSLDVLPEEAETEEIAASLRARQLIAELQSDEGLGGLARLTRDLMAAIYLPNRVLPRDEAPSGGFADISNRGSLDRLLLSELAHDDLTLSVRVALNEALYVKREPPGEKPQGAFSILLDAGIRLWGVPRVYATAVALALVAVQSRKRSVSVFRAHRDTVVEVDLLSRDGLTEHLEALEPELHPGDALADFVAHRERTGGDESVVVTESDTVLDPDFRACLRRIDIDKLYVSSVTRSGQFRLLEYPALDGRPLSSATLALDDILPSEATTAAPVIDPNHDPDLPVILAVRPFPFLFPVRGRVQHVINDADGRGACVTRDGRLLAWEDRRLGARQVTAELPRGQTVLVERVDDGVMVVKVSNRYVRIVTVGPAGEVGTIERALPADLLSARFEAGSVLLIYAEEVEAVDPRTGERQAAIDTGEMLWARGRYFAGNGWHALAWDGVSLRLVNVPISGVAPEEVVQVFDSPTHEGPLVICRADGIRRATGELVLSGDIAYVEGISADGTRVLTNASDGSFLCFDLATLRAPSVRTTHQRWLDARAQYVPTRSLRRRMTHVTATPDGRLEVRSPKGKWLELTEGDGNALHLAPVEYGSVGRSATFQPLRTSSRFGCELSVALFRDGTRVFWDSRGMLHVKSSDPGAPEMSFLLGEWEVAAWCSDGSMCGPAFFVGRASRGTSSGLLEKLATLVRRVS